MTDEVAQVDPANIEAARAARAQQIAEEAIAAGPEAAEDGPPNEPQQGMGINIDNLFMMLGSKDYQLTTVRIENEDLRRENLKLAQQVTTLRGFIKKAEGK